MRILIYGLNFAPELTGVGKFSGEMAEWLARRGHEVRVVTAQPYYPEWRVHGGYSGYRYTTERREVKDSLSGAGIPDIEIRRCPLWVPSEPAGLTRLLHLFSFSFTSLPVVIAQAGWKPDVVWVAEPTLFCVPAALLTARIAGVPAWLHVQDFELEAAFEMGFLSAPRVRAVATWLECALMKRLDRVSTISQGMLRALAAKGVPEGKTVFFPNWVDTDAIFPGAEPSPFRSELGIPPGSVVVLYSGNMGRKQGLEDITRTAMRVGGSGNLFFVLCGEGSARRELEESAAGLRNVCFMPLQRLERLNDLLNLADIHILPQRADIADLVMPSKLTGMLASGRPVVATARPGTQIAEVVDGRGLVVPPGDTTALASALQSLAQNAALRQELGATARLYAVEHLSRDAVLTRFEGELTRLQSPET